MERTEGSKAWSERQRKGDKRCCKARQHRTLAAIITIRLCPDPGDMDLIQKGFFIFTSWSL